MKKLNTGNMGRALALAFLMNQKQTPVTSKCVLAAFAAMTPEDFRAFKEFTETGTFLLTEFEGIARLEVKS